MNQDQTKRVDLSEVDENRFYLFHGQIMSGSQLWAYLFANEPALKLSDFEEIEEIRDLSKASLIFPQKPTEE